MKKMLLGICGVLCFMGVLASVAAPVLAALPECVDHGQTCIIGGTSCCGAADTCSGKFPNTTCQ